MAVELLLERRPFGFVPCSEADEKEAAQFATGAKVRASLTRGKSNPMLRFYWALVTHVAGGIGMDKDSLSTELLIRTGRIDSVVLRDGSIHAIPRSISRMDHPTFREYVDAAISLLCAEYVPSITRSKLLATVGRMVGVRYADLKDEPEAA